MAADRIVPPRRRLSVEILVGADSTRELAIWLHHLATELVTDVDVPESVDRSTHTAGAAGRIIVDVDEDVTAETYDAALSQWTRDLQAAGLGIRPHDNGEPI